MNQSFDPPFSPVTLRDSGRPGRRRAAGTSSRMKPKSSSNWSTMTVWNDSARPSGPASRHSRRDESAEVRNTRGVRPSTESSKRWAPLPVARPASQRKVAGLVPQSAGTASVSHSALEVPSEALTMRAEVMSG
jgi:hypothetical protein